MSSAEYVTYKVNDGIPVNIGVSEDVDGAKLIANQYLLTYCTERKDTSFYIVARKPNEYTAWKV